jgi:hypothetical protein
MTTYDETKVFEKEIEPKIRALFETCTKHNIPFAVAVHFKESDTDSAMLNAAVIGVDGRESQPIGAIAGLLKVMAAEAEGRTNDVH